eukprot:924146-Pyramimonas_sp.AAC.1
MPAVGSDEYREFFENLADGLDIHSRPTFANLVGQTLWKQVLGSLGPWPSRHPLPSVQVFRTASRRGPESDIITIIPPNWSYHPCPLRQRSSSATPWRLSLP